MASPEQASNPPSSDQPQGQQPPWPQETGVWHTYPMHCHCATIRWTITVSPPIYPEHDPENKGTYPAVDCNCSYCERNGILPIHPLTKNIKWVQGREEMRSYLTASKKCPQWFCGRCGSTIGTDLGAMLEGMGMEGRWSINVSISDFSSSFAIKRWRLSAGMMVRRQADMIYFIS